jgi:hypothetical protein
MCREAFAEIALIHPPRIRGKKTSYLLGIIPTAAFLDYAAADDCPWRCSKTEISSVR